MAKVIGFEQDPEMPDGAGVFHFDTGKSWYGNGSDPELAAQIGGLKGALDAAPDERTADNSPAPFRPTGFAGKLHDQGQLSEQRSLADLGGAPLPQDQAILDRANAAVGTALAQGAAPPGMAPGQGPMAPPPPDMQQVAGHARDVMGQRAADDILRGTKRTYVPGSPGVDPDKMNAQGRFVHGSQSTVTESGAPYDPEQAQARIGAASEVYKAQMAGMDLERQQTENELNRQRAIAPALETAATNAQIKADNIQYAYRTDRSKLQQELDDYDKTAHVNPDKFFQDRGLFATLGLAIAQGMGAYASTMTGAPNFAYQMVQQGIDRDIAAQREQIESGRVGRRNKMAQMMDNYGFDMNQAEAAMKIAMNKSAATQAQMFANEAKLPHYQQQAQLFTAQTNQEILKGEQALQAASIGKQTKTMSDQFVQPKAATSGGYREKELSPEEYAARAKLLPTAPANPGQDWNELKPEQRVDAVKGIGTKKQEFAEARTAFTDLASAYGLRVDWQRGELVDADGKPVNPDDYGYTGKNLPGVGVPTLSIQANRRAIEARARVEAAAGKALSGASVSKEQGEFVHAYSVGDDDASAVRGLARSVTGLNDVERDTEAGFPDEARQEYERRRHVANRDRKTAGAPVKVSDY